MRHLDLFSGIGGFALAADRVWGNVEHTFCEIDPFCVKVLQKHWHNAIIHGDIKKVEGGGIGPIDLLTGGFPCQPFSAAGKRKGSEDDRHLWPEMFRLVREVQPRWIIGENVGGILTWSRGLVVEQVFSDLESAGYETQPFIIPAAGVGAPHRRDRVWFVAHRYDGFGDQPEKTLRTGRHASRSSSASMANTTGARLSQRGSSGQQAHATEDVAGQNDRPERRGTHVSDASGRRFKGRNVSKRQRGFEQTSADINRSRTNVPDTDRSDVQRGNSESTQDRTQSSERSARLRDRSGGRDYAEWAIEPAVGRVAHGVPNRVDRIKALGNAIVPQVAEQIMRGIYAVDPMLS